MNNIQTFNVVEPIEVGMNKEKLLEMDKVIPSLYKNLNGIIVIRSNKVVLEKYYNGYGVDDTHHVASVTKSFISALIGIAIDKGYIKSIDKKVLEFFPEYTCHPSQIQKKAITLRDLLTMRAPYMFKMFDPMEKIIRQKDWIQFMLDMLGKNGKIGDFKYSNSSAHILSAIITRTTGISAREFANEHLFKHIGIKEIPDNHHQTFDYEGLFGDELTGWAKDHSGNSTGGWGLKLTTRDMARFGLLYLNDGSFNQKQIVPSWWIHQSTEGVHIEKDIGEKFNCYGYLWCVYKKDNLYAYMALGDGGNMICCIPEKEIVVAISSQTMRNPRNRFELIENYILPSII